MARNAFAVVRNRMENVTLDGEAMCFALSLHPLEVCSPSDLLALISALFGRKSMQGVHDDIDLACLAIHHDALHSVGAEFE
jgi:hypothetical protein